MIHVSDNFRGKNSNIKTKSWRYRKSLNIKINNSIKILKTNKKINKAKLSSIELIDRISLYNS